MYVECVSFQNYVFSISIGSLLYPWNLCKDMYFHENMMKLCRQEGGRCLKVRWQGNFAIYKVKFKSKLLSNLIFESKVEFLVQNMSICQLKVAQVWTTLTFVAFMTKKFVFTCSNDFIVSLSKTEHYLMSGKTSSHGVHSKRHYGRYRFQGEPL